MIATARELYLRHFASVRGAKDPAWVRLVEYRAALLLLERCETVRRASEVWLDPKTATALWERDFRNAQGARRLLAFDLANERRAA